MLKDQPFYEKVMTAEVLTRLTTDTSVVQSVVGSTVSIALRNILLFVGGMVLMLITSTKLTLLTLLLVPLIIVPILVPLLVSLDVNLTWFAILVAVNLQTAWLSPPVALSAYFLKGVVPQWDLTDIYLGMMQFMGVQLLGLVLIFLIPGLALWLPDYWSVDGPPGFFDYVGFGAK